MHIETPLLRRRERSGRELLLKMDCWQPTGSFKIRGIGHLCRTAQAQGARRLVSSSGGNAGMAAAYAGRQLGLATIVVVPSTTADFMLDRLRALGAEVVVVGSVWDEADRHARELAALPGSTYVPPFDHPDIWTGHTSLIHEAVMQGPRPDAVVLSVGGGGLMCGVLQGMAEVGWQDVPLIAVETTGAASLAAAMAADALVEIDEIATIASSLGARRVAAEALAWTRRHPVSPLQVSDREALQACLDFADAERVLVEPACGASLAALKALQKPWDRVLVVVCGGSAVTLERLESWRRQLIETE